VCEVRGWEVPIGAAERREEVAMSDREDQTEGKDVEGQGFRHGTVANEESEVEDAKGQKFHGIVANEESEVEDAKGQGAGYRGVANEESDIEDDTEGSAKKK
jgi:hypothetical protein